MAFKPQIPDPEKARGYFQDKLSFTTGPVELNRWHEEGEAINIVDVRRAEDFQEAHIPGAVSIPKDQWESPSGLRKDKINVLYCYSQVCHLAATAALLFASQGYPVMELEGGFDTWQRMELPVEAPAAVERR
jgi:rhodanese-related sulfurtransferase